MIHRNMVIKTQNIPERKTRRMFKPNNVYFQHGTDSWEGFIRRFSSHWVSSWAMNLFVNPSDIQESVLFPLFYSLPGICFFFTLKDSL